MSYLTGNSRGRKCGSSSAKSAFDIADNSRFADGEDLRGATDIASGRRDMLVSQQAVCFWESLP
jgi:hypothetical protein